MEPLFGVSCPKISSSKVVLPAPLGPSRATTSFLAICRFTSWRTVVSPYEKLSPETSIIISAPLCNVVDNKCIRPTTFCQVDVAKVWGGHGWYFDVFAHGKTATHAQTVGLVGIFMCLRMARPLHMRKQFRGRPRNYLANLTE